jgi:hypothetical protein
MLRGGGSIVVLSSGLMMLWVHDSGFCVRGKPFRRPRPEEGEELEAQQELGEDTRGTTTP